ncbi:14654_t:CDS:10, partial [Acaulospora colombiana]
MPKREPTPPPGDDEPNLTTELAMSSYFTIVTPYPLNADMEVPGDVLRLAQWLAEVTGDPNSPRIVIIEVDRSFKDVRRLLGQHFWAGEKGFLINPPPDIASFNYSAIFYCHYTTGRMVQKHGWKRIDFMNKMFGEAKNRANQHINVPSFEPTAIDLCRNLPTALFQGDAPKPGAKAPPPGSSAWATNRELRAANKRSKKEEPSTGEMPTEETSTEEMPIEETSTEETPTEEMATEETPTVNATSDATNSEPANLWNHVKLASDLAQSSVYGGNEELTLLANRGYNKNAPSINTKAANGARPSNNGNAQSPITPTSPPPKRAGPSASNVKPSVRAPPPPMFLSPVSPTAPKSETNDPSVPAPSKIEQVAINSNSGPVRGVPAWSSRGRGRGRAFEFCCIILRSHHSSIAKQSHYDALKPILVKINSINKPPDPENLNYSLLNKIYQGIYVRHPVRYEPINTRPEYKEYSAEREASSFKLKAFTTALDSLRDLPFK